MPVQGLGAAAGGPAADPTYEPRLVRAAHEFEAQMLKELLKPLAAGASLTGDGGQDGPSGILGEFASEALGRGLSEQGGFGIADRILGQFSRSGNHPGMDGVTEIRNLNTSIKGHQSLE